jgi:hypothetical protein
LLVIGLNESKVIPGDLTVVVDKGNDLSSPAS